MDDATARLPEADAILGASTGKKVVYFLVGLDSILQVSLATKLVLPEQQSAQVRAHNYAN